MYVTILVSSTLTKAPASWHQSPSENWRGFVMAPHAISHGDCAHPQFAATPSAWKLHFLPSIQRYARKDKAKMYGSTMAVDPHLRNSTFILLRQLQHLLLFGQSQTTHCSALQRKFPAEAHLPVSIFYLVTLAPATATSHTFLHDLFPSHVFGVTSCQPVLIS